MRGRGVFANFALTECSEVPQDLFKTSARLTDLLPENWLWRTLDDRPTGSVKHFHSALSLIGLLQ
jgi:hypothetical protein